MIAEIDMGGSLQWRLVSTSIDGTFPKLLSDWWIIDPNISPAGDEVIFMAFPDNVLSFDLTQLELHKASYDAVNDTLTDIVRLSFNSSRDHDPTYAPDGSQIIFSAGNASYTNVDLMRYDLVSQTEQILLDDNASNGGSICYSPDGQYVYFHSLDILAYPFQIKRIRLSDGYVETMLSASNNGFGYFHPEVY